MSPSAQAMSPRYVRLSGEIADQAILDHLRACYPRARVGHAYASTEAGVGFEVDDGLAGFPAGMLGRLPSGVEMKVERDTLRIRSNRTAVRYVGGEALAEADGFVDTGDIVERHGDRYFFVGRSNGVINVGGLKVHPEEVEAVINGHPEVRMSLVRPRKSPITGSLVVADVVLRHQPGDGRLAQLQGEILRRCRESLTQHKVPTAIRFVPALAVAATGKLARHHA
jgi:acyl-coenzyme A synthetase/AMP-(fatty) acid ligase